MSRFTSLIFGGSGGGNFLGAAGINCGDMHDELTECDCLEHAVQGLCMKCKQYLLDQEACISLSGQSALASSLLEMSPMLGVSASGHRVSKEVSGLTRFHGKWMQPMSRCEMHEMQCDPPPPCADHSEALATCSLFLLRDASS